MYGLVHYVYILRSKKYGTLYKGSTSDLKARLAQPNRGKVASTKARTPWELIYYEGFASKTDALREELFLKPGKGRERLKYLLVETLR